MAFLNLPPEQDGFSKRYLAGDNFCTWVNEHLKPESRLGCSANDLWAARCGLLHTGSGESHEYYKPGSVINLICYVAKFTHGKEIHNVELFPGKLGDSDYDELKYTLGRTIQIDFDDFFECVKDAVVNYYQKITSDSEQEQAVINRVTRYYDVVHSFWQRDEV